MGSTQHDKETVSVVGIKHMVNAEVKVEDKTKKQRSQKSTCGMETVRKRTLQPELENLFSSTIVNAEEGRGLWMEAEPISPCAAGTEESKADSSEGILSTSFTTGLTTRWKGEQGYRVK